MTGFNTKGYQIKEGDWNSLRMMLHKLSSSDLPSLVINPTGVLSKDTDADSTTFGNLQLNYDTTQFNEVANKLHILYLHTEDTERTCVGVDTEDGTGVYSTYVGYQAGMADTGGFNTFIGAETGKSNTTGFANTGVGAFTFLNVTTAARNTAFGYYNLINLFTGGAWSNCGFGNTSVGAFCASEITTGFDNVAFGYYALTNNRLGYSNMAIGSAALRNLRSTEKVITAFTDQSGGVVRVTATGHGLSNSDTVRISGTVNYDGYEVITYVDVNNFDITATWVADDATGWVHNVLDGNDNVAIGVYAGGGCVHSGRCVFIGSRAGFNATDSVGCVFIGYMAGEDETGDDKLYIANSDTATPLVYGDFSTTEVTINGDLYSDRLGVGTAPDLATDGRIVDIYSTGIQAIDAYITPGYAAFTPLTRIAGTLYTTADKSGVGLSIRVGAANADDDFYFLDALYIENIEKPIGATVDSCAGIYIENITAGTTNYAIYTTGGLVYHKDCLKIVPPASASSAYALQIIEADGPQFRIDYDSGLTKYIGFTVSSSGNLTITASGGSINLDNENLTTTGIGKFGKIGINVTTTYMFQIAGLDGGTNLPAPRVISAIGGAGGAKTTAGGSGYAGGVYWFQGGVGGAYSGAGAGTGGTGGSFYFQAGVGGAATTTGIGGLGGGLIFYGGTGGVGTTLGGGGGPLYFYSGDGESGEDYDIPGGAGGLVSFIAGDGGNTYDEDGGDGGDVIITAGNGGTDENGIEAFTGGDGGDVFINAGVGGSADTEGEQGHIYLGKAYGNVRIGSAVIPTAALDVDGNCKVDGISYFGDGGATNYSKFESDGTLEFNGTATVWDDINVGGLTLGGPAANLPDEVTFIDENGVDTGIYTYGFAAGEKVSSIIELLHGYKEGSDITFHVHWQGDIAPTGVDKVKWQLTYTVGQPNTTLDAATIITVEADYDTQYENILTSFAAITGTNFNIGDQFKFTLERIAASADEYGGDAKIDTVGLHFEKDTVGSRQILIK